MGEHSFIIIGFVVLVVFVAGFVLAGPFDNNDPEKLFQVEKERILLEQQIQESEQTRPIRHAVYAGLGTVLVASATLLAVVGFRILDRKARTIRPDQYGIMPAVILRPGELLVDAGQLAGPLKVVTGGAVYQIPQHLVSPLQSRANQGAATTRTMRAWATHYPPEPSCEQRSIGSTINAPFHVQSDLPPIEVLTGDESMLLQLLGGKESCKAV